MIIERVWFDEENIFIKTDVGHTVGNPIAWFQRLAAATTTQRLAFEISPYGVHWPELDEDLSLEGFFSYKNTAAESRKENTAEH